jgi:Tfp pilus assembly protein PilO
VSEKKKLIITAAAGLVAAIGLGVLIYFQEEEIDQSRQKAAKLDREIKDGESLIQGTRDLERQVIIHRETDQAIKQILPGEAELTAFAITLEEFKERSGIEATSIKRKRNTSRTKTKADFQEEGYTLNFGGEVFQLLAFMHLVESHSRFMSIPSFKITAAKQKAKDSSISSFHQVTMDVVTYVYQPKSGAEPLKIDNYERKRDLLVGEIAAARAALTVPTYEYKGARRRRDPFLDPRIPLNPDDPTQLSVEEQTDLVESLVERTQTATEARALVLEAENLIARMKAQKRFQDELRPLLEEVERVEGDGKLTYRPARKRFENEVLAVVEVLGEPMDGDAALGPTLDEMRASRDEMQRSLDRGSFEGALLAYEAIEGKLTDGMDESRMAMVLVLEELRDRAVIALEFDAMPMDITGVIVDEHEGGAVATINGRAVTAGEMLDNGLIVRAIQVDEIEFLYRGVSLVRLIGEH